MYLWFVESMDADPTVMESQLDEGRKWPFHGSQEYSGLL
jgi:hypothetical protein